MAVANGEYYYNWYAAMANPYQCLNPTSNANATTTNDGYALGSICPAGWKLLEDGTGDLQINNSAFRTALGNYGVLSTTGDFISGSRYSVGYGGNWWSSTRGNGNNNASYLYFSGNIGRNDTTKAYGFTVRCMRSR